MLDRFGDDLTDLDVPDREWSAAQARALAIVACPLCNDDGYRLHQVCDHIDHTEAAKRGMAKVREALGWPAS